MAQSRMYIDGRSVLDSGTVVVEDGKVVTIDLNGFKLLMAFTATQRNDQPTVTLKLLPTNDGVELEFIGFNNPLGTVWRHPEIARRINRPVAMAVAVTTIGEGAGRVHVVTYTLSTPEG